MVKQASSFYVRHAIIASGSRDLKDLDSVDRVFAALPLGTLVIHGDAKGLDKIAQHLASTHHGLPTLPMPAQWKRHGKRAGPWRNREMLTVLQCLERCGYKIEVHAFPLEQSRGTYDMLDAARAAGVTCYNHGHQRGQGRKP